MSTYMPNPFNDEGVVEKHNTCATFYSGPGGRNVRSVTYVQLFEKAAGLVEYLTEMGFLPGDRLLLVYPTSPDFLVALIACRMGGFVAVPWFPPSGKHYSERVARIVKDCDALGVLTSSAGWLRGEEVVACLAAVPAIRNVIDTDLVDRHAPPPDVQPLISATDAPVLIQYTSGSTGRPKGVVVTAGSLAHNLRHQHDQMHAGLEGANVSWLPFHHDMGLYGSVLQTLYWGAHTVFLPPLLFVQKPHLWLDLISHHRAARRWAQLRVPAVRGHDT